VHRVPLTDLLLPVHVKLHRHRHLRDRLQRRRDVIGGVALDARGRQRGGEGGLVQGLELWGFGLVWWVGV